MEQDSCIDMVVLELSRGFDVIKHILKKKKKVMILIGQPVYTPHRIKVGLKRS